MPMSNVGCKLRGELGAGATTGGRDAWLELEDVKTRPGRDATTDHLPVRVDCQRPSKIAHMAEVTSL